MTPTVAPGRLSGAPPISILDAIHDRQLFRPWFRNLDSWQNWFSFLRAAFALPMGETDLAIYTECTGRSEPLAIPSRECWLCVGRRGGKSLILATIALYLAIFREWSGYLVPGESALVQIIATDRRQAQIIHRYARSMLLNVPLLEPYVAGEKSDTIELTNGIRIEITTCSFRAVRGGTVVAALLDEIAFWRNEDSANPDQEIINALRPAMATVPGSILLAASSPYAKKGVLYRAYRDYYAKDGNALFWKAATRTMNPSVPQSEIDDAIERDPSSAAAEFGSEFRSDIEAFVSRETIDACTIPGRLQLPPISGTTYFAAVDPSGGSSDSMTLAIAHNDKGVAVLDLVREVRPPFSPESVVATFAETLKAYRCHRVVGDRYAGEFAREPFRELGLTYDLSERPASDIYRDSLPLLTSGKAELLDVPRLAMQLHSLERRVGRSGKDLISHPTGGHDDVVNVAMAALLLANRPAPTCVSMDIGAYFELHNPDNYRYYGIPR